MKIGYVRVSSTDQNTARQEELMERLGVDKVYIEKVSCKNTDRPELQKMMNFLREGDELIVESISRFARNTKDLLELVEELNQKNVQFICQKESIDTKTSTGKFMLTVFGAIAELERGYILERQREGIEVAKEQGKYKGRPAKKLDNFYEVYWLWYDKEITATEACRRLEISRSTFYRKVKELDEEKLEF